MSHISDELLDGHWDRQYNQRCTSKIPFWLDWWTMNICPPGILINQFQIHSLCGANLFVSFICICIFNICFHPTICMSFSFECVPTQWKSLSKCNLAHSGAPSKKPPWEDSTSNGTSATYLVSILEAKPNGNLCRNFYLRCIIFTPARRQMEYWSSEWNGKSVPTFLAPNAFSSKQPCDSRLWGPLSRNNHRTAQNFYLVIWGSPLKMEMFNNSMLEWTYAWWEEVG